MAGKPPQGWPVGRHYKCLKQFVSREDWELHRCFSHDASVACGVGSCTAAFTPSDAEALAFHRRRHPTVEEPPRKKSKGSQPKEGDGTGQELGVDPASISMPQLTAAVHPLRDLEDGPELADSPLVRGLLAES
ncbi:unnamed protein product, partial [Owenia fusiformis]